ncbi:AAA family ATPase [Bacteroides heparinolyticus]|uniref:AAA family ATPase n=1 Tax=Prevotella heparinolytica TaxID=28113 RepID=UPI0035A02EC6
MSRIKVKYFGPIQEGLSKNNGWIDIRKVTVFIGNQGSGKSTIAKLISTFSWIEKVLTRGDFSEKEFTATKFKNKYCGYHRITSYFQKDKTEIHYEGDSYKFSYTAKGEFLIKKVQDGLSEYLLPQIMYVPAERNFISMVNKPNLIKQLPDALLTFLTEYDNAKKEIKGNFNLPINSAQLEYNKTNDVVSVKGEEYKVKLAEASSGFHSLVPLYLVSWHLSQSIKEQAKNSNKMSSDETKRFEEGVKSIWENTSFTDAQRRAALSVLSSTFNKSAFINIVEEPEQNLFPSSQWQMMKSLLAINNSLSPNKLIITTHSPYLINVFTIAVKAGLLINKVKNKEELNEIYPTDSVIYPNDIVIYELDENKGIVAMLEDYDGLPSDENSLNNFLEESNDIFANLLEIQQKL